MSDIENRLRDALNAAAGTVDPDRPRPLPEVGPARPRRSPWILPLAAVAGVLLIVAAIAAIRLLNRPPDPITPAPPKFVLTSVFAQEGMSGRLEVRETRSGRVVSTGQAPEGMEFGSVAGTGDNTSFYVTSSRTGVFEAGDTPPCETAISRVKLDGAGSIAAVEPVAGSPVRGTAAGNSGSPTAPGWRWPRGTAGRTTRPHGGG